jgi:hypothetical protein
MTFIYFIAACPSRILHAETLTFPVSQQTKAVSVGPAVCTCACSCVARTVGCWVSDGAVLLCTCAWLCVAHTVGYRVSDGAVLQSVCAHDFSFKKNQVAFGKRLEWRSLFGDAHGIKWCAFFSAG